MDDPTPTGQDTMTDAQIEKVAAAIESVRLFSRFNDWTSDCVPGFPVEICRHGNDDEDEIIVVARYPKEVGETEARRLVIRRARAVAALEAMKP
jgi:hypothetical protein